MDERDDGKLHGTLSGQAALLTELLSTALEPHLERAGITHATFDLLSAIRATDGAASQAEIARRLRISPPTLSQALRAASERGLIERTEKKSDARVKLVRLTPQGRRAIDGALRAVNQLEREVVEELNARELSVAVTVLRRANQKVAAKLRSGS